ncbi:hypothetical protein HB936_14690, partial [Listeria welshimeri]|nr:hypothetical protein [Listeria welshimeri]
INSLTINIQNKFANLKSSMDQVGTSNPVAKVYEGLDKVNGAINATKDSFGLMGTGIGEVKSGIMTFSGSIDGITSAFANFGASIQNGDLFTSLATSAGGLITSFSGIVNSAQGFIGVGTTLMQVKDTISNLAPSIAGLSGAVGKLIPSFSGVTGIIGKLNIPMMLIIAGIALLVGAFI